MNAKLLLVISWGERETAVLAATASNPKSTVSVAQSRQGITRLTELLVWFADLAEPRFDQSALVSAGGQQLNPP